MSEEMQPATTEAQADRPPHVSDIIATADQPLLPAGAMDTCPQEVCVQSSNLRAAESENIENLQGNESDPIELELVSRLEVLLTKDAALSATYGALLRNHRNTGRERRTIRAELWRLHTEEGAVLLQVKLHRGPEGTWRWLG